MLENGTSELGGYIPQPAVPNQQDAGPSTQARNHWSLRDILTLPSSFTVSTTNALTASICFRSRYQSVSVGSPL